MALTEKLQLLLDFNADGAVRGMNDVARTADRQLGKAEARIDRMGQRFTRAGAGMLMAGGVMAKGLWEAGQAAGDFGETLSKSEQVFGDASSAMVAFAEDSDRLLMSKQAALDAASGFGILTQALGYTQEESAATSKDLTTLAADLSSMHNTSPEEAVLALGAALRGESEPIRRFGVMLDDATVKAKAVEMGLADTTSSVDNHAKAQARLAIIMEQSAVAQGDAVRTGDSLANQQKKLSADFENMKISIGEAVLPAMTALVGTTRDLFGSYKSLSPEMQGVVGKAAAAGTVFLVLGGATSMVIGQVIKMRENFSTAKDAIKGLTTSSKAAKVALAGMGVLVAAAALNELANRGLDAKVNIEAMGRATDSEILRNWRQEVIDSAVGVDMFRQAAEQNIGVATHMRDVLAENGREVGAFDEVLREAADGQVRLEGASNGTTAAINRWVSEGLRPANEAADEAGDTTDDLAEDVISLDEAFDNARKSVQDYFDELNQIPVSHASVEAAIDKTVEALAESGINYDDATEAGRRNLDNVRDLEAEMADYYTLLRTDGKMSSDEARAAMLEFIESVKQSGLDAGASERAVNDLYTKMLQVDDYDKIDVTIEADVAPAYGALNQMMLDWAGKSITIAVNAGAGTVAGWAADIPKRAAGGPVAADKTYLVGEKGPELFTPTGGGTITPNHALGGGGINITVNAGMGTDGTKVAEQIVTELKKYKDRGGNVLAAIS